MEILRIAYARAWCDKGFIHFLFKGPIAWFILIFLCWTIFGIIKGSSFPPDRQLFHLFMAIACGFITGIVVFPIIKWQSGRWDRSLTDDEANIVKNKVVDLRPFRQAYFFIIVLFIFNSLIRYLFGTIH